MSHTREISLGYVPLSIGFGKPKEDYERYLAPASQSDAENDAITGTAHCDEVVISGPVSDIVVAIDYPLGSPARFRLKPDDAAVGFTRLEIVKGVIEMYTRVYKVEAETSTIVPGMSSPTCLNRNATDGKYRIWGHDMEDLILHTACFDEEKKTMTLELDS